MTYPKKNLFSATLINIFLSFQCLTIIAYSNNRNSDIPKEITLELIQESEWLSALAPSIPENEKDAIVSKLKAGSWLSAKQSPTGEYRIFSQNGKRRALTKFIEDEKTEDLTELNILDSLGGVAWKGTVGCKVTLSNDGIHFTADYSTGSLLHFYNIKMGNRPLFTTGEPYDDYKFSEDGQYFVAVGRRLDFYTADGKLLWRKKTGTAAPKLLALTHDLSRISVVSNTAVTHDNPPEFKDEEILDHPEDNKQLRLKREPIPDKMQPQKRLEKKTKTDENILQDKSSSKTTFTESRKSYLTYLNAEGAVISQMELDYQVIEGIVSLPDEPNLILIDARINLLLVDGQAKTILWKYPTERNFLYQITNTDFSKDGTLIAMGVISDVNRKESPRYVILLNKNGKLLEQLQIEDTYESSLGGPLVFFGEKEYLLVRSQNHMWVYKIFQID